MKSLLTFIVVILFFGCNQKESHIPNKKLLAFKSAYLSENGDDKYDSILKKNKLNKLEVKYINDIIYASFITEMNACVAVKGDIQIKSDTIYLTTYTESEEVCASTSLERLTYIINNYTEEKYHLLIK